MTYVDVKDKGVLETENAQVFRRAPGVPGNPRTPRSVGILKGYMTRGRLRRQRLTFSLLPNIRLCQI